jgi:hypothetical protein
MVVPISGRADRDEIRGEQQRFRDLVLPLILLVFASRCTLEREMDCWVPIRGSAPLLPGSRWQQRGSLGMI